MERTFTFGVRATKPGSDGRTWLVVRAINEREAVVKARETLPDAYLAFAMPVDRASRLLDHAQRNGLGWLGGLLFLMVLMAPAFRSDEDGHIRMSWIEAIGAGFISISVVALSVLLYRAFLDWIARGAWLRSPEGTDVSKLVENMEKAVRRTNLVATCLAVAVAIIAFSQAFLR